MEGRWKQTGAGQGRPGTTREPLLSGVHVCTHTAPTQNPQGTFLGSQAELQAETEGGTGRVPEYSCPGISYLHILWAQWHSRGGETASQIFS